MEIGLSVGRLLLLWMMPTLFNYFQSKHISSRNHLEISYKASAEKLLMIIVDVFVQLSKAFEIFTAWFSLLKRITDAD